MDDMKLYPQLDSSSDDSLVPMPGIDGLANLKDRCFSVGLSRSDLNLIRCYINRYSNCGSKSLEEYYEGVRFGMDLILEVIGLDMDIFDIEG